jgi:hypothetical protein
MKQEDLTSLQEILDTLRRAEDQETAERAMRQIEYIILRIRRGFAKE